MNLKQNKPILIIAIILITLTVSLLIFLPKKTDNNQPTEKEIEDITKDWETYTNELANFTLKYPSDWELSGNLNTGPVLLLNGSYGWMIQLDPTETFGYLIDNVEPSFTEQTQVSPSGYTTTAITHYISRTDMINKHGESVTDIYNIDENTWDGTVLYTDGTVGFGPGEINDDIPYNYFGIRYWYRTSDNFKDVPEKGNSTLEEMIKTMNLISNTLTIDN